MAPLRELLKKEAEWSWNTEHDAALEKIMLLLTSTPVLKPFDLRKSAHIQADASQNVTCVELALDVQMNSASGVECS